MYCVLKYVVFLQGGYAAYRYAQPATATAYSDRYVQNTNNNVNHYYNNHKHANALGRTMKYFSSLLSMYWMNAKKENMSRAWVYWCCWGLSDGARWEGTGTGQRTLFCLFG